MIPLQQVEADICHEAFDRSVLDTLGDTYEAEAMREIPDRTIASSALEVSEALTKLVSTLISSKWQVWNRGQRRAAGTEVVDGTLTLGRTADVEG